MILPKIIMQAIIEAHTISTPDEVINEKLNNVHFVSRARKIKTCLTLPCSVHVSCFYVKWASGGLDTQINVFLCCFAGINTQISAFCCLWESLCFLSSQGGVFMHIMYHKSQHLLKCYQQDPPMACAV